MITNIPQPEEFLELSKDRFFQALNLIVENYKVKKHIEDDLYDDMINKTELFAWISFIYQAVENFLKSRITEQSRLLLIPDLKNLKALPSQSDKDFSDLYQYGWEDLLIIYATLYNCDQLFVDKFKDLQKERNKIIHSLYRRSFSLKQSIIYVEFFCFKLYWIRLWEFYRPNNNFHWIIDGDVLYNVWRDFLELLQDSFPKKKLKELLWIVPNFICNCPSCSDDSYDIATIFMNKTKKYECLICGKEFGSTEKCKDCSNDKIEECCIKCDLNIN